MSYHKLVCPACGETENATSAVSDTCNGVPMLKLTIAEIELARAIVDKTTGYTSRDIDVALLKVRAQHAGVIARSDLNKIEQAAKALGGAGGGHV